MLAVRRALAAVGYRPEDYSGHNFRIGPAMTAAAGGVPLDVIKALGHWKSQAYQLYNFVRLPQSHLTEISRTLAPVQHDGVLVTH